MDKIEIFISRLEKKRIKIKLIGNYPWIYIYSINNKKVTDIYQSNHKFTVALLPIRTDQEIQFTNISEIFKLIRKYL